MPDIEWLMHAAETPASLSVEDLTPVADAFWTGTIERVEIAAGLRVFLVAADVARDMVIEPVNSVATPWLAGQVSVSGVLDHRFTDGSDVRIAPEQGMLFRPLVKSSVVRMRGGQRLRLAGYAFDLNRAEAIFEGRVPGALAALFARDPEHTPVVATPAAAPLRRLAGDLFAPGLNGPLRGLFMEGVALQMLALQTAALGAPDRRRPGALSARERALLQEARDRLLADMRNPPSLGALAASLGLTERRLNAGFRALYGLTAYELLRRERLEHARLAIATEAVVLKEIAHRVGYNHVSNFINAFTAHFGMPPRAHPDARRGRPAGD